MYGRRLTWMASNIAISSIQLVLETIQDFGNRNKWIFDSAYSWRIAKSWSTSPIIAEYEGMAHVRINKCVTWICHGIVGRSGDDISLNSKSLHCVTKSYQHTRHNDQFDVCFSSAVELFPSILMTAMKVDKTESCNYLTSYHKEWGGLELELRLVYLTQ